MPIQQDQLIGQLTGITFEDINNARYEKIVHNGSDFFTCKLAADPLNPILTYYNTAGSKVASYAFNRANIFDVDYERTTGNYFQLRHVLDSINIEPNPSVSSWSDTFSIVNTDNIYRWLNYNSSTFPTYDNGEIYIEFSAEYLESNFITLSRFDVGGAPNPAGFLSSIEYKFDRFDDQNFNQVNNSTLMLKTTVNTAHLVDHVPFISIASTMSGGYHISIATSGYEVADIYGAASIRVINIDRDHTRNIINNFSTSPSGIQNIDITISAAAVDMGGYVTSLKFFENGVDVGTFGKTTYYDLDRPFYNIIFESYTLEGVLAPSGTTWPAQIKVGSWQYTTPTGTLRLERDDFYNLYNPDYPQVSGNSVRGLKFTIDSLLQELPQPLRCITLDNFQITESGVYTSLPTITTNSYVLALEKVNDKGEYQSTIVNKLDILPEDWKENKSFSDFFAPSFTNGRIGMAIDDNKGAFIKVLDDIYRVNLSGTYSPSTYYDESSANIDVASGIITATGINSYQFNYSNLNRFLQYVDYDEVTTEVRLKTFSIVGSGAPIPSPREVFLSIPDWNDYTNIPNTPNSSVLYHTCLHGTDNNTLFYFRKHGVSEQNAIKSSGTNGASNGTLFTSSGATFITSGVKPGDIIKLSGGSPALTGIVKAVVTSVVSNTSLLLNYNLAVRTGLVFSIASNAAQVQFNIDSTTAAFASLNALDFSLRAGTADTTSILAEVIDCWGEPLSGKNVTFAITQGDGVINPPSAFTNASGIASTTYFVGNTAGIVQIQATITD